MKVSPARVSRVGLSSCCTDWVFIFVKKFARCRDNLGVVYIRLGLQLNLSLPCLRLSSGTPLTTEQVNQLLGVLQNLLGSLGAALPTDTAGSARA